MNKNRMIFRNKAYFLTVVIPLAHVYCKTGIANAARNGVSCSCWFWLVEETSVKVFVGIKV